MLGAAEGGVDRGADPADRDEQNYRRDADKNIVEAGDKAE